MTQYWWSNEDNKRKIPWVAWNKMCRAKQEGGLGFHDLSNFNQALLSKQAWRLLSQPDTLVGKLYKGRYYSNRTFMSCGLGPRPSYAWRSILHGRDLLQLGLLKLIGDGCTTNIWSEKWLLDHSPRPPETPLHGIGSLQKVSQLLLPGTGCWNVSLVRSTFNDRDADLILKTKTAIDLSDSYIWTETVSGVYSVQSGKRLLENSDLKT